MSTLGNLRTLYITKTIADSGTTGNVMPSRSKVINIKNSTITIEVKLPAVDIIKSKKSGKLPNGDLLSESRQVHIFPDLEHLLVLICLFCNNGRSKKFGEKEVRIINKKTKKISTKGGRHPLKNIFGLGINENEMKEKEIKKSPIIEQFSENSVYKCSSKQNLAISPSSMFQTTNNNID